MGKREEAPLSSPPKEKRERPLERGKASVFLSPPIRGRGRREGLGRLLGARGSSPPLWCFPSLRKGRAGGGLIRDGVP